MDRITVYKEIATLLGNKSFSIAEMETLAKVINYLAQEISTDEQAAAEAITDHGPQG